MIKNISQLETKISEKTYHFSCEIDAPLPNIKEALFQFLKYIGQVEDHMKIIAEMKKVEEEKAKNEPVEAPKE